MNRKLPLFGSDINRSVALRQFDAGRLENLLFLASGRVCVGGEVWGSVCMGGVGGGRERLQTSRLVRLLLSSSGGSPVGPDGSAEPRSPGETRQNEQRLGVHVAGRARRWACTSQGVHVAGRARCDGAETRQTLALMKETIWILSKLLYASISSPFNLSELCLG